MLMPVTEDCGVENQLAYMATVVTTTFSLVSVVFCPMVALKFL